MTRKQLLISAAVHALQERSAANDGDESEGVEKPAATVTAVKGGEQAKKTATFAERAIADENLIEHINETLNAHEDVKRGPMFIRDDLLTIYGGDIDAFPEPDSEPVMKVNGKDVRINNSDRYYTTATDAKTGEPKKVKGSFYADFFTAIDAASDNPIAAELEGIRKAKAQENDAPAKYKGMGNVQLESLRRMFDQRRTNGRALIKRAISLHFQMAAVNALADCKCDYIKRKNEKGKMVPINSTVPIYVTDKAANPENTKTMSIGQFLALNPKAAAIAGGSTENLYATSGKAPKGTGTPEASTVTVGKAEATLAMVAHFLEDEANTTALLKLVNTKDKSKSASLVMTIGDVHTGLQPIYDAIKVRYQGLVAAQSAKDNEAAA